MKKIMCSAMGGPADCSEVFTGNTADELIMNGWKHLQEAHSQTADDIQGNPKEVNDKWMADFKANFDNLADA